MLIDYYRTRTSFLPDLFYFCVSTFFRDRGEPEAVRVLSVDLSGFRPTQNRKLFRYVFFFLQFFWRFKCFCARDMYFMIRCGYFVRTLIITIIVKTTGRAVLNLITIYQFQNYAQGNQQNALHPII